MNQIIDIPNPERGTTGNQMNYSVLREFQTRMQFRNFAIKYTIEGVERYTINGKVYAVEQGQYLLANAFCDGSVEIDSVKPVKGICIDVSQDVLSSVVASHLTPGDNTPDPALDKFFNSPDFLENIYPSANTQLGRELSAIGKAVTSNPFNKWEFGNDFYFRLSERIIADHKEIYKHFSSLQVLRASTRKDLYRKVSRSKAYIDQCFTERITMAEVARESALSEYHFFRVFRSMYGISPHQYLLKRKLEKAYELLKPGSDSVSAVSQTTGFTDVFSFSKAFKKYFGFSPSRLIRK